jgi:hypothetical protein
MSPIQGALVRLKGVLTPLLLLLLLLHVLPCVLFSALILWLRHRLQLPCQFANLHIPHNELVLAPGISEGLLEDLGHIGW